MPESNIVFESADGLPVLAPHFSTFNSQVASTSFAISAVPGTNIAFENADQMHVLDTPETRKSTSNKQDKGMTRAHVVSGLANVCLENPDGLAAIIDNQVGAGPGRGTKLEENTGSIDLSIPPYTCLAHNPPKETSPRCNESFQSAHDLYKHFKSAHMPHLYDEQPPGKDKTRYNLTCMWEGCEKVVSTVGKMNHNNLSHVNEGKLAPSLTID
jgi:hypothetical protein